MSLIRDDRPTIFARLIRYYIQNTTVKFGRALLMQITAPLIRRKNFIDKAGDGNYYWFDLTQWIDKNLYFFGHYEKNDQEYLKSQLKPDSVFLDIGANIGIYSLMASRACSKIFSFEPDPVTRQRLEQNIKLNHIKNIRVIPYAASDRKEEVFFYTNPSNRGMNSLYNHGGKLKRLLVRTTTVDDTIAKLKVRKVSLIKMDIEGNELRALRGCVEAIKKFQPTFLVEINEIYTTEAGFRLLDIYRFFFDFGYRPFSIKGGRCRRIGRNEFSQIKQQNVLFKPQKHG